MLCLVVLRLAWLATQAFAAAGGCQGDCRVGKNAYIALTVGPDTAPVFELVLVLP